MSEIEETDVGQIIYDSSYNKYIKLTSNEITLNDGTNNTIKIYNNVIEGSTILFNGQINFSSIPEVYINNQLQSIVTSNNLNNSLNQYAKISDINVKTQMNLQEDHFQKIY